MRDKSLGRSTTAAIAVLVFLALFQQFGDLTIVAMAVVAIAAAIVLRWALDIVLRTISTARHDNGFSGVASILKYQLESHTPDLNGTVRSLLIFVAAIAVVSATVGTGIPAVDDSTPSMELSGFTAEALDSLEGEPTNESSLSGSFERIQLDGQTNTITIHIDSTDKVDGVHVVGPSKEEIGSKSFSAGARKVEIRSDRPLRNGTYEIIGVRYDVNSDNLLLSQAEEVGSQEVQLNVTSN